MTFTLIPRFIIKERKPLQRKGAETHMKKMFVMIFACLLIAGSLFTGVSAAGTTYTVVKGDSLWKIAVKYQIGVSEIIEANPQFENPNLIYPGQLVHIPELDTSVLSYEQQVVDLVNEIRRQNGFKRTYFELGAEQGCPIQIAGYVRQQVLFSYQSNLRFSLYYDKEFRTDLQDCRRKYCHGI